jgi:hypothetical protein
VRDTIESVRLIPVSQPYRTARLGINSARRIVRTDRADTYTEAFSRVELDAWRLAPILIYRKTDSTCIISVDASKWSSVTWSVKGSYA